MESAVIGALIAKLTGVIEDGRNLRRGLNGDLEYIKRELEFINACIQQNSKSSCAIRETWIRQMRELAYDIEDCIDRFAGKVARVSQGSWMVDRFFHQAKAVLTRTEFAKRIKGLKDRAVEASEQRRRYLEEVNATPTPPVQDRITESSSSPEELTGFDRPKEELLELLEDATTDKASMQLRVISIVGCRGLGKTALARAVYESDKVTGQFPCWARAWVVASKYSCNDAGELLKEILKQVEPEEEISRRAQPQDRLRQVLQKEERYLIIMDDMIDTEVWDKIKCAFPDKGTNGRIILTTTIGKIATYCSIPGGSVYNLQALSKDNSDKLLLKHIFGPPAEDPSDTTEDLEIVLKKCDGLPLALVSFGNFLKPKIHHPQTWDEVRDVFYLGSLLETDPAFTRMKQSLMESYSSLADYDLKSCLLYVSIFPEGHEINRKSLVRQWLAEGLVAKKNLYDIEKKANKYFYGLIDRNIINPVDVRNNSNVKTCQVRGMMLDFIVHRSVEENFVALMRDDTLWQGQQDSTCVVRRLSIHRTNNGNAQGGGAAERVDLSRIRSLASFEQNVQDLVNFRKCKSLRVLDLENCKELKDSFFDDICRLLQLRYLNIRGAKLKRIPKKVSKLKYLETLDVRSPPGTRTALLLPMEVLTLPRLAHLSGRFQLPGELNRGTLKPAHEALLKKSILQTLAGFLIDEQEQEGLKHIMLHMRKLVKVKIWSGTGSSTSGPTSETTDMLVASLRDRFFKSMALQSLSVDFGGRSVDFLCSLDTLWVQRSVKLRGRLSRVPIFFQSHHNNLIELCLFSVGLESQNLSALQDLLFLRYLKLVEDREEFGNSSFCVKSGGFKRLMELCFDAPKLPELSIEQGAMPNLASLQLLSADEQGPAVITNIAFLKALKEVTLSSSVSAPTKSAWEAAAKQHTKKPTVKFSAPSEKARRSP